jgi:hypothetical protein
MGLPISAWCGQSGASGDEQEIRVKERLDPDEEKPRFSN